MITENPAVDATQEIGRAFLSDVQRRGAPVSLEGLTNIRVINLAVACGEEVAMATLSHIVATGAPAARLRSAVAAAADRELGYPQWRA